MRNVLGRVHDVRVYHAGAVSGHGSRALTEQTSVDGFLSSVFRADPSVDARRLAISWRFSVTHVARGGRALASGDYRVSAFRDDRMFALLVSPATLLRTLVDAPSSDTSLDDHIPER